MKWESGQMRPMERAYSFVGVWVCTIAICRETLYSKDLSVKFMGRLAVSLRVQRAFTHVNSLVAQFAGDEPDRNTIIKYDYVGGRNTRAIKCTCARLGMKLHELILVAMTAGDRFCRCRIMFNKHDKLVQFEWFEWLKKCRLFVWLWSWSKF